MPDKLKLQIISLIISFKGAFEESISILRPMTLVFLYSIELEECYRFEDGKTLDINFVSSCIPNKRSST